MSVLLCSTSSLKLEAVKTFPMFSSMEIDTINCDVLGLPVQPIDNAFQCACQRLDFATSIKHLKRYDYYISIENGISTSENTDDCHVVIQHKGISYRGISSVKIPEQYQSLLQQVLTSQTLGDLIHKENPNINPKDWLGNRKEKIQESLTSAMNDCNSYRKQIIKIINSYQSYPDFPKKGVIFQDIFSILSDPDLTQILCGIMNYCYSTVKIDYIVGLESRGFFGILLAKELGVGFIPVRKSGKLPGEVNRVTYQTEYSKDTCEISKNIPKTSRVIIFDDLIATGGSMKAAIDLLTLSKCVIVDCCVLREVVELRDCARKTLERDYTVLLQE